MLSLDYTRRKVNNFFRLEVDITEIITEAKCH